MQQQCWPKECFQYSDSHELVDLCLPMGKMTIKWHIKLATEQEHVNSFRQRCSQLLQSFKYLFVLSPHIYQDLIIIRWDWSYTNISWITHASNRTMTPALRLCCLDAMILLCRLTSYQKLIFQEKQRCYFLSWMQNASVKYIYFTFYPLCNMWLSVLSDMFEVCLITPLCGNSCVP